VTAAQLVRPATTAAWLRQRRRLLGPAVVVVAVVPIVVATVRALARGWVAIGDNGLLLLRTQDVATANHPLLGTWTSASLSAGRSINNPGPLWFDALAPFVNVAGPSVGFAVGVMVANVAAVVLAAWAARRVGGELAMVLVTALSAGLAWSMGSELLFDAWQPHAMLLPFWTLLILLWALAAGHVSMLPWILGVASLLVQTHLAFAYVVAIIGVAAIVAGVLVARRDHRRGVVVRWRRPLVASAIVVVLAWVQPVIDQLAGEGNLGALLRSGGGSGDGRHLGLRIGIRLVGSVVALPPWWTRPGFSDTIRPTGVITGDGPLELSEGNVARLAVALLGLALVAAVLVTIVVVGWRRRDRVVVTLGALTGTAVGACVVSLALTPLPAIGLSPHQMRWLWPVSALVLLTPAVAVGRLARRAVEPVIAIGAVATVVLAVLTLPTSAAPQGPTQDVRYGPSIAALVDQVEDYDPGQRVLFDTSSLRFGEPYSGPVLAALGRAGVGFAVPDEITVRQVGERRRVDGQEQRTLRIVEGLDARTPPPGTNRIAFVSGITPSEEAELDELRAEVIATLTDSGIRLNQRGQDAVAAGRFDFPVGVLAPGADATALEAAGWVQVFITEGYVDLDPAVRERFEHYATLAERASRFTVGIFETIP
jgi:hypothetical protein